MVEKGYSFDFFSDRQLKNFTNSGNKIISGGNSYQTILLPANKLITEKSFQKLVELAKNGATILVYKNLPIDVPGYGQLDARRNTFQQLVNQLQFSKSGNIKKAVVGKGVFLMDDNIDVLLEAAKTRRESYADKGLSVLRRKNTDGTIYFINNRTDIPFNNWIQLNESPASLALFDPMTGNNGLAKWRKNDKGGVEVLLQLESYESAILQSYQSKKTGNGYPYSEETGQPKEISGTWTIEFLNGGPVLPAKITTSTLGSWTEFKGEDVKNFSGTAKYSITFNMPEGKAAAWKLNLGKVNETAELFLNGKKITTLIGPIFECIIPSSALQQTNKLEIIVASLMANRIAYMDRNNIPWKIFYNTNMPARRRENVKNGLFDASAWKPLPAGLSGPVTLTASEPVK